MNKRPQITLQYIYLEERKLHIEEFASLFQQGEEKGFNYFFDQLYPALCFFAARLTGDQETAKEIASDAFIKTWGKHEHLNSATSIKAYLYQVLAMIVINGCTNSKRWRVCIKILQPYLFPYHKLICSY